MPIVASEIQFSPREVLYEYTQKEWVRRIGLWSNCRFKLASVRRHAKFSKGSVLRELHSAKEHLVGDTPRKKRASARTGARAKAKKPAGTQPAGTQIVVTLALPRGEVVSVEKFAKSGKRHALSQKEFAVLAGNNSMKDLGAALEETYAAGVNDAMDDAFADFGGDDDELDRFILQEAAGREFAERGVRKLIVRKVLRRGLVRKRVQARKAPHKTGSGQHSHA
jgi:hypothetical protein